MSIGVIKERKKTVTTFAIIMISVFIIIGVVVPISHSELLAATTPTGSSVESTVESIDSTGLNITVQTVGDGNTLSMPVVSPEIIKGVTVGDRVSLELDAQGRVVKILKRTPPPKEAPEPRG